MATDKEIITYALESADDNRDNLGDVSLTGVEEDVLVHFGLSDEEFEDRDLSFLIWKVFASRGWLD